MLGPLLRRIKHLLQREEFDRDLGEEMRLHVDLRAEQLAARGLPAEEASRTAHITFGNKTALIERSRNMWSWLSLERLAQDLRFGGRMLRKAPGFTVPAILTLALGIGANTAIFSLVNSWMLKPLPYPEPDRLVYLWERPARDPKTHMDISGGDFEDWRVQNQVFDELSAFKQYTFALTGSGQPEQVAAQRVTANFFRMLRVQPALGRGFLSQEDTPAQSQVVILTAEYWRNRFGGDPTLIGRTLMLDAVPYTVIGILPPRFSFAAGDRADLWVPLALTAEQRNQRRMQWLNPVARLKPGVTLAQAKADLSAIAQRIALAHPQSNRGKGAMLEPLQDTLTPGSRRQTLLILFGVTCFILLIACANVANLLLARATERHREVAVRLAIGAGRGRLVRQFLVEALMIAAMASVLAVAFAFGGVKWIVASLPAATLDHLPNGGQTSIDLAVLSFTIAVTVLAGVLFGSAPALSASKLDLQTALKEATGKPAGSRRANRVRHALIVAEVALAMIVLSGSGLLLKSFARLYSIDPGFRPQHLIAMDVHLAPLKYPAAPQIREFFDNALEYVGAIPGVIAAGASSQLPFGGFSSGVAFHVVGSPTTPDASGTARWAAVTPGYFTAMQIALVQGRFFDVHDTPNSERVGIINETLAKKFFPRASPLGQRLATGDLPSLTIVGVVRDVKYWKLNEETDPELYQPQAQIAEQRMSLVVRTAGDPLAIASAIRTQIWNIDKNQPVSAMQRYEKLIDGRHAQTRMATELMGLFGALALLLAVIGIYGVMAYAVSQRTREIGIRIALGAANQNVVSLVIRQGMVFVLAGIAIGLCGALAATRVIASMLYATSATDAGTFAAVTALLAAVALLASYLPAKRAARVDPMVALRQD